MKKAKNEKRHSEQDTDTTNTLLCCLSSRTPCHLSKVNQWHIERIPWWFCNHIPWWHSDIFRWPWDALQPCAQGTEKLNERALYVKKSKASLKQRKLNSLIMLFNLSKSRRTQKNRRSQKLAFAKWVKKVQAFLELMNYYWKFVPNYAKIAEPLTQLMHKNKDDIEIKSRRMRFTH
jgi:hypothetical protein